MDTSESAVLIIDILCLKPADILLLTGGRLVRLNIFYIKSNQSQEFLDGNLNALF